MEKNEKSTKERILEEALKLFAQNGYMTGLPVYSLEKAGKELPDGAEIIYLGWIMASEIKGYKDAAKRYKVRSAIVVGMGKTRTQVKEVRDKNKIPARLEAKPNRTPEEEDMLDMMLHGAIVSVKGRSLLRDIATIPTIFESPV